jgi:hypothetical protein
MNTVFDWPQRLKGTKKTDNEDIRESGYQEAGYQEIRLAGNS